MTEYEQAYVDALLLEIKTLRDLIDSADLEVLAQYRANQTRKESK